MLKIALAFVLCVSQQMAWAAPSEDVLMVASSVFNYQLPAVERHSISQDGKAATYVVKGRAYTIQVGRNGGSPIKSKFWLKIGIASKNKPNQLEMIDVNFDGHVESARVSSGQYIYLAGSPTELEVGREYLECWQQRFDEAIAELVQYLNSGGGR